MQQGSEFSLCILEKQVFNTIPSGSGIAVKGDSAYIIGDDATGIYVLNLKNYKQEKIALKGFDTDLYREPKPVKRDFECATLVEWKGSEYLLAFGSGSTSSRDSMLMATTSDFTSNRLVSLQKFYSTLQSLTFTDSKDWNIEGATTIDDLLILLNRGNNLIITLKLNDFMRYIADDNTPFPAIAYHRIKLPSIQNQEAGLSGACVLDNNHILFSASVEHTPDWIKDGPVSGCLIGIYSIRDNTILGTCILKDETGMPVKEKIESLDILQNRMGEGLVLIALGDNDNGTTNLYRLLLETTGIF